MRVICLKVGENHDCSDVTWTDSWSPAGGAVSLNVCFDSLPSNHQDRKRDRPAGLGMSPLGVQTQTSLEGQQPPPWVMRRHRNITHISQYKNIFKAIPKTPLLLLPASNGQSAWFSLQGLNLKDDVSLADPRPKQQHHLHQHCAATIQTRHTTREAPSKQAS